MLADEIMEILTERIINRIEETNTDILKKIGSTIKEIGKLTPKQAHQISQILKYGGDYDKITKRLAKMTNLNIKDIQDMFEEVTKKEYQYAKQYYDYKNKKYIPYKENKALQNQVGSFTRLGVQEYVNVANSNVIGYTYQNLDGTIKFNGLKETFFDVIDRGVLSVSQGKTSFNEEMFRIINQLGGSGLKVLYPNGRTMRLDSAVRMNLESALRDLSNENQILFGEEFGADGVEISVHENPAPDHAEVQGRQFSTIAEENEESEWDKLQNEGTAKDYKGNIIDLHTKYGSFRPISDYNCKHRAFSVILGISEPEYNDKQLKNIINETNKKIIIDGKKYNKYEATQLQRKLERKIREQKDIQIMGKASEQMDVVDKAQKKISQLTKKYKEISNISGLPTYMERTRVSNYKRTKTS